MAISKVLRPILRALSTPDVEISKYYRALRWLHRITLPAYRRPMHTIWDHAVPLQGRYVPVRMYRPFGGEGIASAILFFHGGGWVTGDIQSYDRICRTMAHLTQSMVLSVDYRLAPEHRFPAALEDCYQVTQEVYRNAEALGLCRDRIALVGDSAGGNLAAAVSLMARDKGDIIPSRQVLLYPACAADHTDSSPYPSVRENGADFLLTNKRIQGFMEAYASSPEDYNNPYFAPLMAKDLSHQPDTLIITAQYDPLRDEGEAYARALATQGNKAFSVRIADTLHGYLSLGERFHCVKETYMAINQFLQGEVTPT